MDDITKKTEIDKAEPDSLEDLLDDLTYETDIDTMRLKSKQRNCLRYSIAFDATV